MTNGPKVACFFFDFISHFRPPDLYVMDDFQECIIGLLMVEKFLKLTGISGLVDKVNIHSSFGMQLAQFIFKTRFINGRRESASAAR